MSYEVFARKYRPRTFDELLGQDHVVRTLKNAIEQDRIAQAYLFAGPRGTGKTSVARILAKALNCNGGPRIDFDPSDPKCEEIARGESLDVLEIDGASNRGIDHIRDLRETVQYAPSSSRFKIYYIDEVHMLTSESFNALLKTLEEPPPHVKFIFATTEPNKILPTILSRCQRFDLRRIPTGIISEQLLHIAKTEGIELDPTAAHAIARGAEGGMRDAESMLDQLVAFCGEKIAEADVLEVFGFTAHDTIAGLSRSILSRDTPAALRTMAEQAESGKDLARLLTDLLGWVRVLLVHTADPSAILAEVPKDIGGELAAQAEMAGQDKLLTVIDALAETDAKMRWSPDRRLHFEIGIIRATNALGATSISDVLRALAGDAGAIPAPAPTAPAAAAAAAPSAEEPANPAPEAETKAGASAPAEESKAAKEEGATTEQSGEGEQDPEAEAEVDETAADLSGDPAALWERALEEVGSAMPLQSTWLDGSRLEKMDDGTASIALPAGSDDALEELDRPGVIDNLGKVLTRLAGRNLRPAFHIDAALAAREPPIPEPAPEAKPDPAPDPAAAKDEDDGGDDDDPEDGGDAPESDPLIQEALEVFKGKLEK